MYYRDQKCVYVADNIALAHTVVGWLGEQGIAAEVMNEMTLGGFEGLTAWLPGKLSLRGVEVWVTDPAEADRGRELVSACMHLLEAVGESRANRVGSAEAVCEECGAAAIFSASEQGTVQKCPHCGAYIDVPDPDENWPIDENPSGEE
jgi:hypothetical protein